MTTDGKIRILYLIDAFDAHGGTETQIMATLAGLDRGVFETHLLCLRSSEWYRTIEFPCPHGVLGFRSFLSPDFFNKGKEFIRYCRDHRIGIVQTFFRDANIAGTLWARKAGVPVVIASRRNLGYWHNRFEVAVLRGLRSRVTHYIANSGAAARMTVEVEGAAPEKVSVIPNCLDPARFTGLGPEEAHSIRAGWGVPPEAVVAGTVANLRPVKNLGFLVEAAARAAEKNPNLHFVVLGEGPERPALETAIRSRGLADRIHLPGKSHAVPRDLQAFDFTVMTSRSESSPNAVVESMAAARPAVAPDVGGIGELVVPGETGALYPPGDHESLVAGILDLAGDPARRRHLGTAARNAVIQVHDCSRVLPDLSRLYRQLLRDAV